MSGRASLAESLASWEYDEVTDISEESQPLQQASYHSLVQGERAISTHHLKVSEQISGRGSTFVEHSSKEILSHSSNTSLPQKKVESIHSAFHEGPLEPPSASVDENGGSSNDVRREEGEGETMDGSIENADEFPPGPSHAPPPPHLAPTSPLQDHPRYHRGASQVDEIDDDGMGELADLGELGGMTGPGQPKPLAHPPGMPGRGDDDEEDEDEDDDDDDGQAPPPEGAYDPADYEHLSVSSEISELFSYITRYTPQGIELEHRLRPYIPDYIPAVGDIDAFIKIPPPDNKPTLVGLEVLDEPSARQSDATVLDLQLRALAKHTTAKSTSVKTVENAEKNAKVVEKWVRDISELHRTKPPPTVHYSKRMPDIDSLMQEWPGEVEELLKEISLPTAALQLDLSAYVDIICATLDIPVYKSRIQSLHVLFTLYSVFKNSAHFRQLAEDNYIENDESTADRLVIQ
ncbi:intraflagellar transport protein 46 homolog isoform X3 [Cherax quadricarinatus]|uniref:intraflagellar transport protein 46 homolog isoform X3 n=1 Tax=Cherax quadricarinatus TaxID=27406 RepID=UPI00387E9410